MSWVQEVKILWACSSSTPPSTWSYLKIRKFDRSLRPASPLSPSGDTFFSPIRRLYLMAPFSLLNVKSRRVAFMDFMIEVMGEYPKYIYPPFVDMDRGGSVLPSSASFRTLRDEFRSEVSSSEKR